MSDNKKDKSPKKEAITLLVAHNIRRLRAERGLTQEAFAEVLDVERTYLVSLENAYYNPSVKAIGKFSTLLKIHPVEFFKPIE